MLALICYVYIQNKHYAQEVRDIQARAASVMSKVSAMPDGENHPHIASTKARIPVSDDEKKWLFNYFYSMGEDIEKGNYYRYVL